MKEALKELLSFQPNILGGRLEEENTIVFLDYTATGVKYELVFDEDQLNEVILVADSGDKIVIFGLSIKTDIDILNEICFEIHHKVIEYKDELDEQRSEICDECEGTGEVSTTSPSRCSAPIDECCGGCFGEQECENCGGTGIIEY